jgi:hypothetical protein
VTKEACEEKLNLEGLLSVKTCSDTTVRITLKERKPPE